MIKYEELKLGTKVRCINGDGWAGFTNGGVYEVEELWGVGIDLKGGWPSGPVSEAFFVDFEMVEE